MSKKLIKKSRTDVRKTNASLRRAFIRAPGLSVNIGTSTQGSILYRYVYNSVLSFVCVFVLLASLLMQGFYVAYANEVDDSSTVSVSVTETTETETDVSDNTTVASNEESEILQTEDGLATSVDTTTNEVEVVDSVPTPTQEIDLNTNSLTNDAVVPDNDIIVEEDSDEISTNRNIEVTNNKNENVTESTSTPLESATTTYQSISVAESDDAVVFAKDDCTKLEDGSFYCREVEEDRLEDALFSARDKDGDLEIFLVRDGKQAQITENLVDDASPYFDNISNTIVWQRLIDDRFQVISYNLETSEEIQLTDGSVNNMQPTRQGKYTVWQSWLNNSWNIVLYDGITQKQITNDNNHNLAPHIQGSLIIWNRTNANGDKTIEMYNIDSGSYVTVNDPDGLTVDNPRMVLVYDSLHPNGDIVTKGYDIFTGEFIQLDTLPKPLPDIPDSETTTEVKALVQPKPEVKTILQTDLSDDDFIDDNDEPLTLNLATSTDESELVDINEEFNMTLDLSQSTSTDTKLDDTTVEIPDLVIPPFVEMSTSTELGDNV